MPSWSRSFQTKFPMLTGVGVRVAVAVGCKVIIGKVGNIWDLTGVVGCSHQLAKTEMKNNRMRICKMVLFLMTASGFGCSDTVILIFIDYISSTKLMYNTLLCNNNYYNKIENAYLIVSC